MSSKKFMLERPLYSRMYAVLRESLKNCIGKVLVTVFLFSFIESFFTTLGLFPTLNVFAEKFLEVVSVNNQGSLDFFELFSQLSSVELSARTKMLTIVFSFIFRVVSEVLIFGLIAFFSDVVFSKRISTRKIFSGFSRGTSVFLLSVFYALIAFVVFGISFCVFYFKYKGLSDSFSYDFESVKDFALFVLKFSPYVLLPVLVIFVINIFFIFSRNILNNRADISFLTALKQAFNLMKNNFFHFIGFNFYTTWKNALVYVAANLIIIFIPENIMSKITFVSFFLNALIFIQQYMILVKVFIDIPIYYYSILGVNGLLDNTKNTTDIIEISSHEKNAKTEDADINESST